MQLVYMRALCMCTVHTAYFCIASTLVRGM